MVRPPLSPEERARGERLGTLLREARGTRSMTEIAAVSRTSRRAAADAGLVISRDTLPGMRSAAGAV